MVRPISTPNEIPDDVTALLEPAGGAPPPITSAAGVADLARRLAAAEGPVAVDAERASGFRYSGRAYLVQLNRRGVGTVLIDPIAVPDLSAVGAALADAEWVLHAANQDLACLAEIGLRPQRLFDTELAGRLAGFERVSLGAMTERLLRISLAKGHSAADWSRRPLTRDMLVYAALDVEILLELRDEIEAVLREQDKLHWALAEFESVRTAAPSPARTEPWRRTSGIQDIATTRGLAVVRALWEERDRICAELDVAPGRLLADRSIVAAAKATPRSVPEILAVQGFARPSAITHKRQWVAAVNAALALPKEDLPTRRAEPDPNAAPSRWMNSDPATSARFQRMRAVVLEQSEVHSIPAENLIAPVVIRRLAWEPPAVISPDDVRAVFAQNGVRAWQQDILTGPVCGALLDPEPEAT